LVTGCQVEAAVAAVGVAVCGETTASGVDVVATAVRVWPAAAHAVAAGTIGALTDPDADAVAVAVATVAVWDETLVDLPEAIGDGGGDAAGAAVAQAGAFVVQAGVGTAEADVVGVVDGLAAVTAAGSEAVSSAVVAAGAGAVAVVVA
jgi:hypothetical protein